MSDRPVCVVAGVGPGNGLSLSKRFARGGFDVAMIARDESRLKDYEAAIAAEGGRGFGLAGDLSDFDAIAEMFARIRAEMGPVSALIYNAVAWVQRDARSMTPETLHQDLRLCVSSAQACVTAVYPDMRAKGAGTILFTGGGVALAPQYGAHVPASAAGKSALRGLCFALAERARGWGHGGDGDHNRDCGGRLGL